MMQDYKGDSTKSLLSGAEVGFVATLDSTTLTMVLPCNLINNSAHRGDTLTINLMQGESYQLIAQAPGSFSGMEVSSNGKPFAAFQGNRVAYIPIGAAGADLLYEQAVPIDQWGSDYMVVPSYGRSADQLRITSSENDCQVYTDGNLTLTLQKGETYEVALSSAHRYTSTQKICVGRYLRSGSTGGNPGDPSSVILPSTDQGLPYYRFVVTSSVDISRHYINIISDNTYLAGITMDGNNIASQFTQFDNDYSYAQIQVTPGVHLLASSLGPIIADYYGLGNNASKACVLGRTFCNVESQDSLAYCPNFTTAGRDFWVMFLYNYNISGTYNQNRRLYFASTEDATVNVHNNASGDDSFFLTGPNFNTIRSYGNNQLQVGTVFEGGYHITSSADIWLYARNFMQNTLDATVVFPSEALGTRYIVQDYPSTDNHGGEVGFVATEDGTVLSMTVPCGIQGTSITSGTTLSITLNQGQAYMLLAARGGSLSGMEVTSNGKPFAMFHGDWNNAVPQYADARDHCYEQALPVDKWGTEFIFGSIPPQSSVNHVRITASEDNTLITREGSSNIGPLQRGQTWQGSMSNGEIWHLTATNPIQVILYMGSFDYTSVGDPSSVTIPPLSHAICDSRFNCDRTDSIKTETHYLSIVCHEDYDSGLTLDEQPIGSRGTVTSIGNYRYRTVQVPYTTANQGFHRLQNNLGPFVAYAYGYSYTTRESYAFPLGFSFDTVIVGPQPQPQTHRDTVAFYDSVCQGHAYNNNGFSIGVDETQVATILSRMDSTVVDDTTIHYRSLTLTVLPNASEVVNTTLPTNGILDFGDTVITDSGTYVFHLTAANGCDSTLTLHVQFCDASICFEFDGRSFIDFDHPVVLLQDCSPNRQSTRWEFSDGYQISGERARRLFKQPLPDTVIVTLTTCNKDGCCADTTIDIVPKIRSVWFPNIFFPDQEINNTFGCYTSYEVVKFELEIYNRWGFLLWSTTDISAQWDGTYNGKPVPQGAYVYKWFLEDIYGDYENGIGTVSLVR